MSMWNELKQFVEANVSPEMMFGYWIAGTYLALFALALLFVPMRHPRAGAVKKSTFAMALNVLVWCGYLGPCLLTFSHQNAAFITDSQLFMVRCMPDSGTCLLCMVIVGLVLMWYFLNAELRQYMVLSSLLSAFLAPSFLLIVLFPLYLTFFITVGLFLELFLGPLLMLLLVLRLLLFWQKPKPVPPKPEPRKPDPHKPDPPKPEPRKPDPHKPDPPKPDPPKPPKPVPEPREFEPSVAVRALVLSGELGSKTYAPHDSSKRTFVLSGSAVAGISGGGNYPTIIGSFNASACGRVWTFLPTLSADWQMLNNERPMGALNVLRAGDTLTLQRTDSPHPAATLRVSFRMLLVSHRNR